MVFPIGAGNPYRTKSGAQSIENASAEIAAADHYPHVRLFTVGQVGRHACACARASWAACRRAALHTRGLAM